MNMKNQNKRKFINMQINFTNFVGCVVLLYSIFNNFHSEGMAIGACLILGRKSKLFNN